MQNSGNFNAGKVVEKLFINYGKVKWCSYSGNSLTVSLKTQHATTIF